MKRSILIFSAVIVTAVMLISCGGAGSSKEYDWIRYKAEDIEFSRVYGEPVYIQIDFGNLKDPYSAHAMMADQKGYNVFGKLFGGNTGLNSLVDGKYSIKDGYVLIDWGQQNIIKDLPTRLKIQLNGFDGERLNSDATVLTDEQGKLEYRQYKYGNGKM